MTLRGDLAVAVGDDVTFPGIIEVPVKKGPIGEECSWYRDRDRWEGNALVDQEFGRRRKRSRRRPRPKTIALRTSMYFCRRFKRRGFGQRRAAPLAQQKSRTTTWSS